jgi:ABC-2 type transport system permease protein
MNKSLVVAKWEYVEKVKSKAFLIGLFLTPVIMLVMGVLPGLLADQEDESTKVIGVIDATGEIADTLSQRMMRYKLSNSNPNYLLRPIAVGRNIDVQAASEDAHTMVLSEEIEGYIVFGPHALEDTVMEYRATIIGDFRLMSRLESNLRDIFSERRFAQRGIDPRLVEQLKVKLDLKGVKISKSGKKEETDFLKTFFSAYIFVMMLLFLIMGSGQLLVRSVVEEKSNRLVEVLVSSCTPKELMVGKVLGLSALGLTQIAFWALIGVGVSAAFAVSYFPPIDQILLMLIYFILGYLLYSAIFVAFGSPVTTEQEAQQITQYLVLFLILPIALLMGVIQQPNAAWVKVLTYIPLLTPTFMILRIPIQVPSPFEIVATIVLLLVSAYFMMLVAGRIFRIAILATGKRPSVKELVRWATEG